MIAERRISQGEIRGYVSQMGREISDLESRLARLREAHGGSSSSSSSSASSSSAAAPARRGPGRPPGSGRKAGQPGRPGRPPGRPPASASQSSNASAAAPAAAKGGAKKGGRKSAITAEQLASRQLQGRYLALVRQFPERKRIEFAKIAKEKGREAAIKEMQDARK
jgi:hypothetical protein